MDASSNPGSPTSHPAPCLWPGKAVEDGPKPWDPAPECKTQSRLQAHGFGLAQLRLLRSLGEWTSGRKVVYSVSSLLCISDFTTKTNNKSLKWKLIRASEGRHPENLHPRILLHHDNASTHSFYEISTDFVRTDATSLGVLLPIFIWLLWLLFLNLKEKKKNTFILMFLPFRVCKRLHWHWATKPRTTVL